MIKDYFAQYFDSFINATNVDVNSIIDVSIKDANDLFDEKKMKKYITNEICKTIEKNVKNLDISFK